jgi:glycosyltransferase involved in cell wall biosynthesis
VIKKEYDIVPNVVDTDLFCPKGTSKTIFRFIHVSNMVPLKNVKAILDAAKLLKESGENFELIMVGNKDEFYSQYADKLGLNSVVSFKAEIPYDQVAVEMQQSQAFILFSNIENSPCVIGEALCCGLPVIATNVGGIPELVSSDNGILIAPGDTAGLVNAMKEMMVSYSKYDRHEIAEDAQAKFNYSSVGKMFDRIYKNISE